MFKQSNGFSLLELMIVVLIVGILSAISYGFFGKYVTDSNRTDARTALTRIAAEGERCKALYGSYIHPTCAAVVPAVSDDRFYRITGVATATTFTLTATPIAGTKQAGDVECTTLTLTNTLIQGGTGTIPAACWP